MGNKWSAVRCCDFFLFRFCPLKLSLIIRSVGIRTRKATLPGRRRPFRIARVLIFSMSRRRRTTTTTTFCFVLSLSAENKKHKDFCWFPSVWFAFFAAHHRRDCQRIYWSLRRKYNQRSAVDKIGKEKNDGGGGGRRLAQTEAQVAI